MKGSLIVRQIWREYLLELREPALIGPGLNANFPAGLRKVLHYLFITFRYASTFFFFKPIAWLILHLITDFRVRGRENLPDEGGFVGTWNHLSNFDAMVGTLLSPRPPLVMTKYEYFKTPILGGVAMLLGGFPVKRGTADRQAVKTSLAVVKRKQILGIYPEGTRSKTFQLQDPQPGAAMIAASSDARVLPLAISGTENIMRRKKFGFLQRPRVEVAIGPAYNLKETATAFALAHDLPPTGKRGKHDDLDFLSDVMMLKIAEQLPPAYRGHFTPEAVAERYRQRLAEKTAAVKN
jgi:1-acyl-sn-glycerol-3-phosphate acyltransferase